MIACLMYPKSYGRWALDSLCVPKCGNGIVVDVQTEERRRVPPSVMEVRSSTARTVQAKQQLMCPRIPARLKDHHGALQRLATVLDSCVPR